MTKAHNYTAQKKLILGGEDTAHTLLMGGPIGVGTLHNIDIDDQLVNGAIQALRN